MTASHGVLKCKSCALTDVCQQSQTTSSSHLNEVNMQHGWESASTIDEDDNNDVSKPHHPTKTT
eukprot:9544055-Ditylum_brightwellii.AAC.1